MHLFIILIIQRFLVISVYYDAILYSWFPYQAQMIYEVLIYSYDLNKIFFGVAAHVTFLSYVIKHRQPKFYTPLYISILLLIATYLFPDIKIFLLGFINGFGIIATIMFAYVAQSIFTVYDNRRLALISIYFIYSMFKLIDFVNSYQNMYIEMDISYAYPITIALAAGVIIGKQEFLQSIVKFSFISLAVLICGILILFQPDHTIAITQHCSFILFLLLMAKIVIDHRKTFRLNL